MWQTAWNGFGRSGRADPLWTASWRRSAPTRAGTRPPILASAIVPHASADGSAGGLRVVRRALGLAWLLIASHPTTLLAAIENDLSRAESAHLSLISRDDRNQEYKADIWYRRNLGVRVESPEGTIVEDGRFQWSWKDPGPGGEILVVRQPRPGFLRKSLAPMLALPDLPSFMTRDRAPELDRDVSGRACLGYIVTQTGPDPDLPPGAKPVNARPVSPSGAGGSGGANTRSHLPRTQG